MRDLVTPCVGCGGRLGWYDAGNGQWVSCLHCPEGREQNERDKENIRRTQEICDAKLRELRRQLESRQGG